MHHINITKKSKRAMIQFAIYGVFAVLVTVLTIVLIYIVQGYDIDRSTGQVIQNGLILVDSQPEGASITVNGVNEGKQTPSRLPVPANEYTVNLTLSGYQDWNRTFNLEGSEVVWIDYPIFIPQSVKSIPITSLPNLAFAEMSSNRKLIVAAQNNKKEELTLFKLDEGKNILPEPVTIPAGLLTKVNGSMGKLNFVSWGPNDKHVLLRHEAPGLEEFIWIDVTKPSISLNISRQFNLPFEAMRFSKNEDTLLVKINNNLRIIDVPDREISAAVARNVLLVEKAKEDIFYYVTKNKKEQYQLFELKSDTSRLVVRIPEPIRFIDYSEYDSTKYVALIAGKNNAQLYRDLDVDDISRNVPYKTFNSVNTSDLEFSERGRFIMVRSNNNVHVYDIELDNDYSYSLNDVIGTETLTWLDEHHLSFADKKQAYIMDFDGSNRYKIAGIDTRFPVELTTDKDRIFSVGVARATKQPVFQRTELLLSE